MLHIDVGVMAYNEDKDIVNLLQSFCNQKLENVAIDTITVVSSGSTDRTNDLVKEFCKRDKRVRLLIQQKREGKASAINAFLKEVKKDVVVISNADVILDENAVERLIFPITINELVGITSVNLVPLNDSNSLMGFVSNMHFKIHNLLNRHGETIALKKNLVRRIPEIATDEAYAEAVVQKKGHKAVHVNNAIVYKKGPETISDFLKQVRRDHVGHLFLKNKLGYLVSSMSAAGMKKVAKELIKCAIRNPLRIHRIAGYFILEIVGRILGAWDYYLKKEKHIIWDVAKTTKNLKAHINRSRMINTDSVRGI